MISVLLPLLMVSAPVDVAPPASEDIFVIGQRLERTKGQLKRNSADGSITCRVTNSSGNNRIDAAVCDIAIACGTADWRNAKKFRACVNAGREAFLSTYFGSEGV